MFIPLKYKMLLSYLGIIAVVSSTLGISGYVLMRENLEKVQRSNLEHIAQDAAVQIERYVSHKMNYMERIAEDREIVEYYEKYRELPLVQYLAKFEKDLPVMSYIEANGREAIKTVKGRRAEQLLNYAEDGLFRRALRAPNRPVVSRVRDSIELKEPVVMIAVARYAYFGDEFAGMIIGQVPLSQITGESSRIKVEKTGFLLLVDKEGKVLAAPRENRAREKVVVQGEGAGEILQNIKALRPGFGRAVLQGIDGFAAYAPVPVTGCSAIAVLPYEEYISVPNKMRNISMALAFAVFLIGAGISFALTASITGPIVKLAAAADKIAEGDLSRKVEIESNDEAGLLIASFNRMVGNLKTSSDSLLSTIRELRHAEDFIKNILESVDEGFLVIDPEYRIVSANRAYSAQVDTPAEELKGRHCYEVSHHADDPCHKKGEECPVKYTFDTGKPSATVHSHYDKKGDRLFIEVKSFPLKDAAGNLLLVIETLNDITEKKRLEDQVRQSQKLEAIGRLVAGIAHEINNPLANASLYVEALRNRVLGASGDEGFLQRISAIERNIDRASAIARELLESSHRREPEMTPLDIGGIIDDALAFVEYKLDDITVHLHLPETPVVMGDPLRLEQVFINILNNSIAAMPEGGDIHISALALHDSIEVKISDTGSGIPEECLSRVFDPFFTTKGIGAGTGLGLPICYGIINQHKGDIRITSTVGKGTTVIIKLPCSREPSSSK